MKIGFAEILVILGVALLVFGPDKTSHYRYTPEFKKQVVEAVIQEGLSYQEAARIYEVQGHDRIQSWERIYLEEGPEGLEVERRGRRSTGRPKKLSSKVDEDLLAEVQRLRAENAPYYTGRPPAFAGGLPVIAETINEIIFQADRLMKLSFLQLPDTGEGYCR